MSSGIDIKGQHFGEWTVLEKAEKSKEYSSRAIYWLCKCSCGKEKIVSGSDLRRGKSKSCGHNRSLSLLNFVPTDEQKNKQRDMMINNNPMKKLEKDISGQKFGHWTALKKDEATNGITGIKYICQCDCLEKTIRSVRKSNLLNGNSTSCGCDRESKGEKKIKQILFNNNICFESEKVLFNFEDTNKPARFDFWVNNQYVIEYDGEQHFNCNSFGWNNEEHLKYVQDKDKIKNKWCKENNVPLIRIPYTHYDHLCLEDLLLETSRFII